MKSSADAKQNPSAKHTSLGVTSLISKSMMKSVFFSIAAKHLFLSLAFGSSEQASSKTFLICSLDASLVIFFSTDFTSCSHKRHSGADVCSGSI